MKTVKRLMMHSLCILLAVVLFSSCTPVDTSLDGKVLKDEEGNIYKLEWKKGRGATWAFKYPVTVITQKGDTLTEWRYYR